MVGPGTAGDHYAIDHRLRIDKLCARSLNIRLKRWIGRGSSAFEHACSR